MKYKLTDETKEYFCRTTAKLNKEGCKAMREYNPFIGIEEYKWQVIERKCLKKAEEYK